jgi:hypothetical protein
MAKYKLIMKELDFKNKLEFEADGLEDVIANMEIFLKGNGFFFDGALDVHEGETQMNALHNKNWEVVEDGDTTDTSK